MSKKHLPNVNDVDPLGALYFKRDMLKYLNERNISAEVKEFEEVD